MQDDGDFDVPTERIAEPMRVPQAPALCRSIPVRSAAKRYPDLASSDDRRCGRVRGRTSSCLKIRGLTAMANALRAGTLRSAQSDGIACRSYGSLIQKGKPGITPFGDPA